VESPAHIFFDLLDEIELHEGVVALDEFQLVLSELAHQGDIDGLQEVFLRLSRVHGRPRDLSFYTPLLYVYSRLGDVPATERELQTMMEHGLEPNMHCWNILVYAYSRSREPQRAFEVLHTINEKGLAPDAYTFAILSSIVARTGDTNAVIHLAEQAEHHGIQRDYSLVLGLVETFCNNDQSESAEKIVEDATIARLRGNPTRLWILKP
jgi:pentatricopeptide repeat-containing protein PET309